MDNKLAQLVLVLFVAQQLMCAPLEACAQERPAGTQTLTAAGAAGQADSAGASGTSASARTPGSASGAVRCVMALYFATSKPNIIAVNPECSRSLSECDPT